MQEKSIRCAIFLSALVLTIWFRAQTEFLVLEQKSSNRIPDGKVVQLFDGGYDDVFADFYWLSFVQYIGDVPGRTIDHGALSEQYLEVVTTLNPHLISAYYFAAFLLGNEQKQPDRAQKILDAGIWSNPGSWYLPFIAGVNAYIYAHDGGRAARYYRLASTYPDSPKWLKNQADILETKIPSYVKEVNAYSLVYNTTTDGAIKMLARRRLVSLWKQILRIAPTRNLKQRASDELKQLDSVPK